MSDTHLFQDTDAQEKLYAPQQVPGERARVLADGDTGDTSYTAHDVPAAAPVANLGNVPSAVASAPNIGHTDNGGAPGDPQTQGRYPIGDSDTDPRR